MTSPWGYFVDVANTRRWVTDRWINALIVVMAIGLTGHYVWFIQQQQRIRNCQSQFNRVFVEQLIARSGVADESTKAQVRADAAVDGLLSGFAVLSVNSKSVRTPEQQAKERKKSIDLFAAYTHAREEARAAQDAVVKVRAAHPLPPIPNCV